MKDEEFDNATIHVETLDEDFTIISRFLLQDPKISMDAQGILTFFLSLPKFKNDGTPWQINPRHAWKAKNIGRDRVYKAIDELCKLGYMKRVVKKVGNLKGKTTYFISNLKKFFRLPESQDTESQDPESQDYNKNREKKEDKKQTNKPEASASALSDPPDRVVCSFRDDLLQKTELTAPQAMKIKTQFAHLNDKTFKEAIEAFLIYVKENIIGNYQATLISALGGGKDGVPWTKPKDKQANAVENRKRTEEVLGKYDMKKIRGIIDVDVRILRESVEFFCASSSYSFEYKRIDFKQAINKFFDKARIPITI